MPNSNTLFHCHAKTKTEWTKDTRTIFAMFNNYSNFSRNKKNFAKLIAQGFISYDRVSNFKV